MLKKMMIVLLIIVVALGVVACSDVEAEASADQTEVVEEDSNQEEMVEEGETVYPLTFTDGRDREVTIEQKPEKVISLAPSITETLHYIDAWEYLIGRTAYAAYPEKVSEVESIGTLREPNIEKIVELNPDLVIASTHFKEETLNKLEKVGIQVVMVISQDSFEGVYQNVETLGKIFNKSDEASNVIEEMKAKVESVQAKVKDTSPKTVYYVLGYGEYGDFTATGETFISEMIEMAGGKNIAKDGSGWKYSLEKIVEKDPELLICDAGNKAGIKEASGYKELTAVKNDKIYELEDKQRIQVMSPRLVLGLEDLAKIIHPEVFE